MTSHAIELDLHLVFDPPMDEHGRGIVVTRRIDLPFVPFDGLQIYSRTWEECPEPLGFKLKDVVWDADRKVFLATTHNILSGFPFATIPDEVRSWLDNGWRLGSWMEHYQQEEEPAAEQPAFVGWLRDVDDEVVEHLHNRPPKKRPKVFNQFMQAMVRHMVEVGNNRPVAYAMDKTGVLITAEDNEVDAKTRAGWHRRCDEFTRMSIEDQMAWEDGVREYPALGHLLGDNT